MTDSKAFGKTVLERAKAKTQTEAEILLQKYKKELLTPSEGLSQREQKERQAALSIIDSGLFWRGELKGRKLSATGRGPRYQTFPVKDPQHLIKLIVEECLADLPHPDDSERILEAFDYSFNAIASVASYAGVPRRQVRKVWQTWREKLAVKVRRDGPPRRRQDWEEPEDWPGETLPPLAQRLVGTLFFAAPNAHNSRIAEWIITIIKALGKQTVSDRSLRNYIGCWRTDLKL